IIDTISSPGANSTTTSESTAPGVMALIVAGNTLRALNFMKFLLGKSSCHSAQDCIPKRRAFLNPYDRLTSVDAALQVEAMKAASCRCWLGFRPRGPWE